MKIRETTALEQKTINSFNSAFTRAGEAIGQGQAPTPYALGRSIAHLAAIDIISGLTTLCDDEPLNAHISVKEFLEGMISGLKDSF